MAAKAALSMASANAHGDDSDLEDLITKTPGSNVEMINMEQQGGRAHQYPNNNTSGGGGSSGFLQYTPCGLICNLFSLCFYSLSNNCPCLTRCLTILLLFLGLGLLTNVIFNPTNSSYHTMGGEYSSIHSAYDLSLSKVHHWCIQGDNDSCKCEDPLEPTSRSEFKSWNAAHKANVADVNLYRAIYGSGPSVVDVELGRPRANLDVAFLGESVVEAMDGRWLGKKVVSIAGSPGPDGVRVGGKNEEEEEEEEGEVNLKKSTPSIDKTFERFFRKDQGAPVEGCALGIAGDTTSNVLWRIQHDEMPYDFNPKVWWLVLGMNDLTRMQCSEEIVVLGVLRVVEEIRLRKPDAKIVINSLLPMVNYDDINGNGEVKMADFADFGTKVKGDKGRGVTYRKREVLPDVDEPTDDDHTRRKKQKKEGGHNRILRDDNDDAGDRKHRKESKPIKQTKKNRMQDEDNATSGPMLQKAFERKKKAIAAMDKKVKDKVFKDDEKYHPKKPVSPFLPMIKKRARPPVWPSVHLINEKLKEFCKKHDSITFFDATSIFASEEGQGKHRLYNELISPRGHPTELGFQVWEGHITSRLHKLLQPPKEDEVKKVNVPPPEEEDDDYIGEDDDAASKGVGLVEDFGSEHVSAGKEATPPEEGNDNMPDRRERPPVKDEPKKGGDNDDDSSSSSNE